MDDKFQSFGQCVLNFFWSAAYMVFICFVILAQTEFLKIDYRLNFTVHWSLNVLAIQKKVWKQ